MVQQRPIAVIGAGIVGLSTAYALAERDVAVRVYERGVPGNAQSGGDSRIFRHAHDDPRMVRLAQQARSVWDEWSERFGTELISPDGAVSIGPAAQRRLRVLDQVGGVSARAIGDDELAERLPLLAAHPGPAMLDEAGGAIRTRAAVRALTEELGDALVHDEVLAPRPTGRGTVELRTGGGRTECARAIVCAGRDTPRLARGLGLSLPVCQAAHARVTFPVRDADGGPLACLLDSSREFGDTGAYGTPSPGNGTYSLGLNEDVATHEDGSLVDPDGLAALAGRARDYVRNALPGLVPEPADIRHCWVTNLPWSDDGVAVWESGGVLCVAGNNLYKHAPALGRELARAALDEPTAHDLRPQTRLGEPR